jgi:hypothetical protein
MYMADTDLFTQLINTPLFWIVIILVVVYFLMKEYNKGKLKPEQKPDFGRKFRATRTKEFLERRNKAFGFKPEKKTIIYFGYRALGKLMKTDLVNITNHKSPTTETEAKILTYRRFGFFSWFKAGLGYGLQKIIVDKNSIEEGEEKLKGKRFDIIAIPQNAFFRERGGVLFLSKDAHKRLIDEINADADYENAKGFVSDFPRRLSNLHPAHAASTDTLELEEHLEEKKRRSFIDKFKRGG